MRTSRSIAQPATSRFVDSGERPPVPFRDTRGARPEEPAAGPRRASRTMPSDMLVAARRARWRRSDRWTIPSWTRCAVGGPAAARRRRGLRARAAEPPRVHPARHGRRAVDGRDRHGHRGLQRHHVSPSERAASAGGSASAAAASAGASGAGGSAKTRRHDPDRLPAPEGPLDPVAMMDLGELRDHRRSRSSSCAPWPRTRRDIAPGLALSVDAERRRHGVDVQAPPGREVAGRHGLHVGRRRRHDGAPGRRRQLRPQGRHRAGLGGRDRPEHGRPSRCSSANGNFPYLVSVFNAQSLITPADYAAGHDARQGARTGPVPGSSTSYDIATGAKFARNDAWWGGKTPLDATEFTFFDDTGPMVTAYQGGQVDALVQFDVLSRRAAVQRRRTSPSSIRRPTQPPPDLDALRHRPVRRQAASARRWPSRSIDRQLIQQLFKGKAELGQRPRHLARSTRTSRHGPAAGAGHRQGQAAARGRRHVRPEGDPPVRPAAARSRDLAVALQSHGRPGRDHAHAGRRGLRHVLRRAVVPDRSRPTRRAPAPPSSASSTTATAPPRTSS